MRDYTTLETMYAANGYTDMEPDEIALLASTRAKIEQTQEQVSSDFAQFVDHHYSRLAQALVDLKDADAELAKHVDSVLEDLVSEVNNE